MNKTEQQLQQIAEELARAVLKLTKPGKLCDVGLIPDDHQTAPLARQWLELNKGKEEGR